MSTGNSRRIRPGGNSMVANPRSEFSTSGLNETRRMRAGSGCPRPPDGLLTAAQFVFGGMHILSDLLSVEAGASNVAGGGLYRGRGPP